ncbi:MAG: hypothetical protein ACXVVQ_02135 [Solirubrobacteraceae bacterium]
MAVTPTSPLRIRLIIGAAATALIAFLLAATASAATLAQEKASITNATTGMSDASSLVPRRACGVPEPGHAACLAQFLAVRQTGRPVHPHLLPAASPNLVRRVRAQSTGGARAAAVAAASTPVPAPQPGSPAYLQQAYDAAALTPSAGAGQTIAIVDAYDSPNAESDLATYRATFNLPPCTTANGCFQKVNQWGNPSPLPNGAPAGSGWDTEIALDLAAVSAMCPKCKIELVEALSDSIWYLADAQYAAAHMTPTPTVISDSWGAVPDSSVNAQNASSEQSLLQNAATFTFPGIATVAASGDSGYLGVHQNSQCQHGYSAGSCNVYPAALPGVTAAGGTTMVPANGSGVQAARGLSEVAWSKAGSGCDTTEAKPPWQANYNTATGTNTGCTGRAYNDLSAVGDPDTGIDVYMKAAGGWQVVGGTSLASPLIAAYYALVDAGTSPSWAYGIALAQPGALNDPVSGTNGSCPGITDICTAAAGYDGPTGLGTISGAVVSGPPGIAPPGFSGNGPNDFSYTQSVTAASATLQGGVYPNGNDTRYFWQYGPTTAYGDATPSTDAGAGTAPVFVTRTIDGLSPSTTYHYRLVAQSPDPSNAGQFLTQYGYDFTLTTNAVGNAAPGSGSSSGSGGGTSPVQGSTSGSPGTTTTTPTGTTPPRPLTHAPNPPSLAGIRIQALGSGTATVTETLNTGSANTTYYLAYGTSSKLTQRTASAASSKSRTVTWHLRGLRAGTVYYLQAIAANAGGTRRTATVRVKTSPVRVGKITANGNNLQIALRCRGSATCRVRLAVKVGRRTVASGRATVRGNHNATITLKLNRAAAARAGQGKHPQATLSAVSVWNGYASTVVAKFGLSLG